MQAPDLATVHALRSDLALQIARFIKRRGLSQRAAARNLGLPQPTVSKVMNGRVAELSLELLIRIAVRAGLPLVLQIGKDPAEAGAFAALRDDEPRVRPSSRLAADAREILLDSTRQLTPTERLNLQAKHSELVTTLNLAGRAAQGLRGPMAGAARAPRARSHYRVR